MNGRIQARFVPNSQPLFFLSNNYIQRPFICPTCSKSYLRDTHLHAHMRSHQPQSARPISCSHPGCTSRFWTNQHLRVHERSIHNGDKLLFKCSHPSCEQSFSKHAKLRAHIALAHSLPGTKNFQCEHEGCTKSFATGQKLRAHVKTHDGTSISYILTS